MSLHVQCESEKMSRSSAEHGAVTHEVALETAGEGLTAGLKGVAGLGAKRLAVRPFRVVSRTCDIFCIGMGHLS